MFLLVSGAAASGKSTIAKNLSSRVENLVCHDYDERKVTDEYTRCQQLEEWIQLALNHQQEGRDFLLTSHSPLGELLACPRLESCQEYQLVFWIAVTRSEFSG